MQPANADLNNEQVARPPSSHRVSIITLNWNCYEVTRDCLASLEKIDFPDHEVVLVDNGSTDGSADKLATEFPSVRLIRNQHNLGFAAGNNVGIRDVLACGADYVLLLNNDTIVAPDFLSKMVRVAEQQPLVGIVNPKILYYEPANRIWYAGGSHKLGWSFAKQFGVNQIDTGKYDQPREVTFSTGCAMLMRSQVIREIGLLDEAFFFGFEDLDWCIRARKAGYKAYYEPAAVVWHHVGFVTKRNLGKAAKDFEYVRNSVILARKYFRAWHWFSYIPSLGWFLAYRTVGYLVRMEPQRAKALYRGMWCGAMARINGTNDNAV